jgi:hypothetical protein
VTHDGVRGEDPPRLTIAERLKFHRTPGISVAVINDGRVEWAQGRAAASGRKPPGGEQVAVDRHPHPRQYLEPMGID